MVLFVMSFVAFNGKFWESNPTLYPQRHKAYSTNRVVLADDIGTDNTTEEAVRAHALKKCILSVVVVLNRVSICHVGAM
jgi:hypothetical protein